MKRILAVMTLSLVLAACAGGGRGRADIAFYDLGPLPAARTVQDLPGAVALEVHLPAWLDNVSMNYRLAYADVQRVHAYAQARWVSSPLPLLRQRLRQQLGLAAGGAPCTLRIDLDDFSQSFASPTSSVAIVRGEASLLGKGRKLQARRTLAIDVPAASADAAGGVAALADASGRLASTLAQWLKEQDLSACRAAD
jgi:cholesterol transport system auxiliary component